MEEVARGFRKEPTRGEEVLWTIVRGRALDGRKFRRQQPIGPFVVDFFCAAERLVVEVDGGVHESQVQRDRDRQECLEVLGLRFLRISAWKLERNPTAVRSQILAAFREGVGHPSPLVGEGPGVRGPAAARLEPDHDPPSRPSAVPQETHA